jgi:hypothetical protein
MKESLPRLLRPVKMITRQYRLNRHLYHVPLKHELSTNIWKHNAFYRHSYSWSYIPICFTATKITEWYKKRCTPTPNFAQYECRTHWKQRLEITFNCNNDYFNYHTFLLPTINTKKLLPTISDALQIIFKANTQSLVNSMNNTHMPLHVTLLAQHTVANGALGNALMESHMVVARILATERLPTYFAYV